MNTFFTLSIVVFCSFLSFSCAGTKSVGTITCGDASIDVLSIKNKPNTLNGQTWSSGIAFGGTILKIYERPYAGYFPDSYPRQLTGTKPLPEFGMYDFPFGSAIQFFMGEFPSTVRAKLTHCLVDKDKQLRSLLLKTKKMQQFPPSGTFNSRFVFWDAKEKDLKLQFNGQETKDEYLTLAMSKAIYFHNRSKKQVVKVGELQWNEAGKLASIAINLKPDKILSLQNDPNQYKRNGKTLAEYFSVPFMVWDEK